MTSPSDTSRPPAPTGGQANNNNQNGGRGRPKPKGSGKNKNKNKNKNKKKNSKNSFKGTATSGPLLGVVVTQHNHRDGVQKLISALASEALDNNQGVVAKKLAMKGGPQAVTEDMIMVTEIYESTTTMKHRTTILLDLEIKAWSKTLAYQKTLYGKAWKQINNVIQAEIEATNGFDTIESDMDLIALLSVLKQVCNRGSFGGSHDSDVLVVKELKTMLNFRQKQDENANTFSEKRTASDFTLN